MDAHLLRMVEMRASDVFLQAGRPPAYRVDGRIVRTTLPPLGEGDLEAFVHQALTEPAKERFRSSPDVDLAYTVGGVGGHTSSACAAKDVASGVKKALKGGKGELLGFGMVVV